MNIDDLLYSPDPNIAETANWTQKYKDEYEQGLLSQGEYNELMQDLLDLRRIDQLAADLEYKAMLQQVFARLAQFAGIFKAFI